MLRTYSGGSTGAQRTALSEVDTAARNRLNTMLRDAGRTAFAAHDPIPMLYVLTEALHHTIEPLRTHALRALEHHTIPFCVSIPIHVLYGQTLQRWDPWDASPKPVPHIIACLRQIATWKFEIKPVMNNHGVLDSVKLDEEKKPKISHLQFMETPEKIPDKLDQLISNYKVRTDSKSVNAAVTIDFDPMSGGKDVGYTDSIESPHEDKPGGLPVDADPNYVASMSESVKADQGSAPPIPTTDAPPPPAAPRDDGGGR